MSFNILIKDPYRLAVEGASGGQNTVLYDAAGIPSQMYVIPRFDIISVDPTAMYIPFTSVTASGSPDVNTREIVYTAHGLTAGDVITIVGERPSSDWHGQDVVVSSVPDVNTFRIQTNPVAAIAWGDINETGMWIQGLMGHGIHPAFICGPHETYSPGYKSEIFVGQFRSSIINNTFHSLPRTLVQDQVGYDYDYIRQSMIVKGPGWHAMNLWEWSAIAFQILSNETTVRGIGTSSSYDYGDNRYLGIDRSVRSPNASYPYETVTPAYNLTSNDYYTGSGPKSFRHNNDFTGISDIVSPNGEFIGGIFIHSGQIRFNSFNSFEAERKYGITSAANTLEWTQDGVGGGGNGWLSFKEPSAGGICDIIGTSDGLASDYSGLAHSSSWNQYPPSSTLDFHAESLADSNYDDLVRLMRLSLMASGGIWRAVSTANQTAKEAVITGGFPSDELATAAGDSTFYFMQRGVGDSSTGSGTADNVGGPFGFNVRKYDNLEAPRVAFIP